MIFPVKMTEMLLALPDKDWRSLRAETVWRYRRWDLSAPSGLRRYISTLPEDPTEWTSYCKDITMQRAKIARQAERVMMDKREKKRRNYKRDYMRDYMRTKRAVARGR